MARNRMTHTGSSRRKILTSGVVIALVLFVVIVFLTGLGASNVSNQMHNNQARFLEDAVRRSAVQCYALEGSFPESVEYLEENYGLIVDRNRYAVYYEYIGSNLIPQIYVVYFEQ